MGGVALGPMVRGAILVTFLIVFSVALQRLFIEPSIWNYRVIGVSWDESRTVEAGGTPWRTKSTIGR
jgi:hypothetical protein